MNDLNIAVIQWRSSRNSTLSRKHLHILGEQRTFCGAQISTKGTISIGGQVDCLTCTEEKPGKWTEN